MRCARRRLRDRRKRRRLGDRVRRRAGKWHPGQGRHEADVRWIRGRLARWLRRGARRRLARSERHSLRAGRVRRRLGPAIGVGRGRRERRRFGGSRIGRGRIEGLRGGMLGHHPDCWTRHGRRRAPLHDGGRCRRRDRSRRGDGSLRDGCGLASLWRSGARDDAWVRRLEAQRLRTRCERRDRSDPHREHTAAEENHRAADRKLDGLRRLEVRSLPDQHAGTRRTHDGDDQRNRPDRLAAIALAQRPDREDEGQQGAEPDEAALHEPDDPKLRVEPSDGRTTVLVASRRAERADGHVLDHALFAIDDRMTFKPRGNARRDHRRCERCQQQHRCHER